MRKSIITSTIFVFGYNISYLASLIQQIPNMAQPMLKKSIDAHSRSESTTIIMNPFSTTKQVITIGHDSYIRAWKASDLSVSKTLRIIDPYLTAIVAYDGKFLVGVGSGKIIVVSSMFQIQCQYVVHQDCVTKILVLQEYIATCSYDGTIKLLDKLTLQILKTISLPTPIQQIIFTKTHIYTASKPSYKIPIDTLNPIQLPYSCTSLTVFNDIVFGCSDQQGLISLNSELCEDMEIEANSEFVMAVEDGVVFVVQGAVGLARKFHENAWRHKLYMIDGIQKHCMIKSGVEMDGYVYLTGESGDIYKFELSEPKQVKL